MSEKSLPKIIGALASDGLSLVGVPGSTVQAAIEGFFKRRSDAAREIMLEELNAGVKSPHQLAASDEDIACIIRYLEAARLGAARVNLRLMARAYVGQVAGSNLVADEFLQHVTGLSTLSRSELIVLATMLRVHARSSEPIEKFPWIECLAELESQGWSQERAQGCAAACMRSGFVVAASAWDLIAFRPSPQLLDLARTVDFDDALKRERNH